MALTSWGQQRRGGCFHRGVVTPERWGDQRACWELKVQIPCSLEEPEPRSQRLGTSCHCQVKRRKVTVRTGSEGWYDWQKLGSGLGQMFLTPSR